MARLGWSPDTFWRATPADLLLALEGLSSPARRRAPMGREELEVLRRRFPDRPLDAATASSDKPEPW